VDDPKLVGLGRHGIFELYPMQSEEIQDPIHFALATIQNDFVNEVDIAKKTMIKRVVECFLAGQMIESDWQRIKVKDHNRKEKRHELFYGNITLGYFNEPQLVIESDLIDFEFVPHGF